MKTSISAALALTLLAGCAGAQNERDADGWIPLFDGRSLDGWRASENPETFSVRDGMIVVDGPRAHLFYVGPVENHDFEDFEFKADVMTEPGANSGMYFHTEYQEEGWPSKGYEVQVNNTHTDWRKTGSLYAIDDVREQLVQDNEWFTQHVIVRDNHVTVKVNGRTVVEYTEPENPERPANMAGRLLDSGTVALQGHDPNSRVYYRNIMVRPLD